MDRPEDAIADARLELSRQLKVAGDAVESAATNLKTAERNYVDLHAAYTRRGEQPPLAAHQEQVKAITNAREALTKRLIERDDTWGEYKKLGGHLPSR